MSATPGLISSLDHASKVPKILYHIAYTEAFLGCLDRPGLVTISLLGGRTVVTANWPALEAQCAVT